MLYGSPSVSDELVANFLNFDIALGAAPAAVVFLKKQVLCTGTEKKGSEKKFGEVREEAEEHLKTALDERNRPQKLTRSLVTEFVNAINAFNQQLGHGIMNRLRQGVKTAYTTAHVTFQMVLTRISGAAAIDILWTGQGRADDGELELTESRSSKTSQGSTNGSQPGGSGKGCVALCQFFGVTLLFLC